MNHDGLIRPSLINREPMDFCTPQLLSPKQGTEALYLSIAQMISESAFMSFVQIKNWEGFSETKPKQKNSKQTKPVNMLKYWPTSYSK